MNDAPRVTQRDVAERAGYDKSTVSLALSGSPRVARETRDRIVEVAEQLGYRPDPAIAQIARYRWAGHEVGAGSVLAYVVERKRGSYSLQLRHLEAVQARATERGFRVEPFDLSEYRSGQAAGRVLYSRGIRGLLMPALPSEAASNIQGIDWQRFTVVGCSLGWLKMTCHVVTPDVFEGTRMLWREAVARGYRRIGAALFRHDPVALDDRARLGASFVEQSELGPEHVRVPFHTGGIDDREAFLGWFREHRPDVVIGFTTHPCTWLRDAGVAVPGDVAFAGLNVRRSSGVSGVPVQIEEVGRRAVDYLISEMHANRWGLPESPELLLLPPEWQEGKTLPRLRASE